MNKKHRATGNPRGRPSKLPVDIEDRILKALERRIDATTGLARPDWKGLARELHVSRSTISRVMPNLRAKGLIESVVVTSPRNARIKHILYKVICRPVQISFPQQGREAQSL